jgi:tetratricopeptide (TPR) repeat protein
MSHHRTKSKNTSPSKCLFDLPAELASRFAANRSDFSTALLVAEHLARNQNEAAILDVLESLAPEAAEHDQAQLDRFRLLLASGLSTARRYAPAEKLLKDELSDEVGEADRHFLLTGIKYALREYEAVTRLAPGYLKTGANTARQAPSNGLFQSSLHRARVLTWLGEAYSQLDQPNDAVCAFQQALWFTPKEEAAYLGLARTLVQLDHRDEAAEVIAQGIEQCRNHDELVMLREYLLNRPRISACMIVKDEEKLLPGCLESIRDWVDEIVIVDTGSSDRTRDIAREYGARLFEQSWTGDFSHHRNQSIEQASGDWVFIIDADERFYLEDVPLVIDALREGRCSLLSVGLFNVYGHDEERRTFSNSVRFFKRDLNLRYAGIVHNALELPQNTPILHTRARIKHLGYNLTPEQMAAKFQRTRQLLQQQLADNPADIFALFNYAELLRGVEPIISEENAAEIIRAAGKVVELIAPDDLGRRHLRLMAFNQLAVAYLARRDYRRALDQCMKALVLRPNYLDALINSGLAQFGLRDFQAAIASFEKYCQVQADFDVAEEAMPIILSFPDATDIAHNSLGALYELTGRADKAENHYLKALEKNPHIKEAAGQLGRLYLERGEFESAEHWFRSQLLHHPTLAALTGLASVLFQTGRFDQAESHYQQAIARFGACWSLENDLGNSLYKQNRFGEAEQHYLRAAELKPDEPVTFLNLALTQTMQGRRRDAVTTLEHYLEAAPGDPSGWQLMAEQLKALGSLPEALACFENAVRLDPHGGAALLGLSDCYLIMGQSDAAALGYRQLLQFHPENRLARDRLEAIEKQPVAREER